MQRSRTSWILAAACVCGGGLLCAAPETAHDRLRGVLLDVLKPGMNAVVALRRERVSASSSTSIAELVSRERQLADDLQSARFQNRRLEIEAARLRDELKQANLATPKPYLGEAGLPLFAPDLLSTHVLNSPAIGEIERTVVTMSEGSAAQVALAEWVLAEEGVTIDHGRDANVAADQPVLAGRSVFGRVASTGRYTSRVWHVTDPGFRAHARLVRRSGEKTVTGAEGLLSGAGNGVCRLELIAATEPVEPGDLVLTAATIPGIDEALYLGEVKTAHLAPGATHWSITVSPAVAVDEVRELQVVRVGLNPGRVAEATP